MEIKSTIKLHFLVQDVTIPSHFLDKFDWNGRYETPAGKTCQGETPQAEDEEAPQNARGKRLPGVDIKSTTKLHFLVQDVTIPSHFSDKFDWNGRYETPAGKTCLGETPQAEDEEAPQTARGKRVPGVEIESTTKLHFLVPASNYFICKINSFIDIKIYVRIFCSFNLFKGVI
ncbi:hypothetical protein ACQKML_12105 [Peribacillus frigoritolerans]